MRNRLSLETSEKLMSRNKRSTIGVQCETRMANCTKSMSHNPLMITAAGGLLKQNPATTYPVDYTLQAFFHNSQLKRVLFILRRSAFRSLSQQVA
jgi:hypothetical protein